ncbi:MAG TPA: DmsC/YnfH family molybdoenzyme membrane anchor subunit [Methylococcaceae bacterium]|nr:DmsC/YnfH family molybdoenzyme membrane anchor subunit [Methylococcaceae bacterium]
MAQADPAEAPEDELFGLRGRLGTDAFPKAALDYLNDWAANDKGWLRKFYPHGKEIMHRLGPHGGFLKNYRAACPDMEQESATPHQRRAPPRRMVAQPLDWTGNYAWHGNRHSSGLEIDFPTAMFPVRNEEPAYAFIPPPDGQAENQWGKPVQTVDESHSLAGQSLNINGDTAVGPNPNRYQQHGFHFSADHCIGCHACEAACSEKNDLPAHISFRSVGYVEGGSWPAYRRLNISMACNHCDDPVCLKGCPTRAYTKFAEYGAVLQDPDICFGCGYCTWVCPYNAPQLDPVKGQVSKCNMCVDRLEVGLKPACAAACLGGALDFGVIETAPEGRTQVKLAIPGFPDPGITHPNIRFQQTKSLPAEMTRPDSMPLRYVRAGDGYEAKVAERAVAPGWNLKKLRSREDPLVVFTLISQGVVGAFLTLFLGPLLGLDTLSPAAHPYTYGGLLFVLLGLQTFALVLSTLHLGKPQRFYRAFNNLKFSPVSREVAAISVFYGALAGYALLTVFPLAFLPDGTHLLAGWGAALTGPAALYAMYRIYRIEARPFWDHWQTATSFCGSMLALGPLAVGLVYAGSLAAQSLPFADLLAALAWPMAVGLALEGLGLLAHAKYLERRGAEAAASHFEQRGTFGKTYVARNAGLVLGLAGVLVLGGLELEGSGGFAAWLMLAALIVTTAVVGRALFYVLVVPTTLPGAFFWRNRAFQEHARETGLAELPQVGVLPEMH